ncbi:hypothetical protein [uncultured Bacteroides sp.]|uniref:hypothetical protein n=1 Tax=uncultured Bacteroides sp. TaxID=162156 RepID=UPI0025DAF1E9|nr:hypothetical protein [uncultured Bacteroides sp.]
MKTKQSFLFAAMALFAIALLAACGSSKQAQGYPMPYPYPMPGQGYPAQGYQNPPVAQTPPAQAKASSGYSDEDEINEKLKEYSNGGWQIHGSARTLRGKLTEHYAKLAANPGLREITGTSTGCRSITVCRAAALNAASMEFAVNMGQDLRGKTLRDMGHDEAAQTPDEFNRFHQACIGKFQASVKGDLEESIALIRKEANGVNSYEIHFLVDKEKVHNRRKQAIQDALEESKLRGEYAESVKKFIDDEFE